MCDDPRAYCGVLSGKEGTDSTECEAQKIACDKTQPSCSNCRRRGTECLGYSLKLSWPRVNDSRRALKGHQHLILPFRCTPAELEFVNTTSQDVELWDSQFQTGHYYLPGNTGPVPPGQGYTVI